MKTDINLGAVLLALALVFTSAQVFADPKELRNLDKFTKIDQDTSAHVYLRQGSVQKVEVETRQELLGNVITEVSNGKLKITMKTPGGKWTWNGSTPCNIYITAENIDAISLAGSGDLTAVTPITGNNLELKVTGSGDLKAELALRGDLELSVSGSGDVNVKGKFQNVRGDVSGSGDAELTADVARQAVLDISGSGDIKVSGKVPVLEASISGSGELSAYGFEADSCKIRLSGSGDAQVFVKNDLDARTSGSGDIAYKGNPARVSSHNSGSGSVNKN